MVEIGQSLFREGNAMEGILPEAVKTSSRYIRVENKSYQICSKTDCSIQADGKWRADERKIHVKRTTLKTPS